MKIAKTALISALAVNVGLGLTLFARAQIFYPTGTNQTANTLAGNYWVSGTASNNLIISNRAPTREEFLRSAGLPTTTVYHQHINVYFDADGNKLETKSSTHAINFDCNPQKETEDRIDQDDGRGNVQFAQVRLPSEPANGQAPVTRAAIVTAMMAAKSSPVEPAKPTELAAR